jgi:hypothetical protein
VIETELTALSATCPCSTVARVSRLASRVTAKASSRAMNASGLAPSVVVTARIDLRANMVGNIRPTCSMAPL